jgi:1,4-dihydroxy-2-naphthoate octaprenyltransferase
VSAPTAPQGAAPRPDVPSAPGAAAAPGPRRQGPPGRLTRWILAIRPKTLPAAVAPVVVGTAVAYATGGFRAGPAVAALTGAVLLQIGANLANDVLDFERGADTADRLGPTRVVQAGLLDPGAVWVATGATFLLALLVGVYLVAIAGWPVVVIGLASIAAAVAYTGGPYPLGYNGLGDIAVLIFFGFVAVCGTVWVQALALPALAWWAAVPVGALITAILVVNNLRDRATDASAGKRTLAVRFGRTGALAEYVGLLVAAYLVPVGLVAAGRLDLWGLLPLLSLPLAISVARRVLTLHGRPLNAALAATARLVFVHGALFAAGIALGG